MRIEPLLIFFNHKDLSFFIRFSPSITCMKNWTPMVLCIKMSYKIIFLKWHIHILQSWQKEWNLSHLITVRFSRTSIPVPLTQRSSIVCMYLHMYRLYHKRKRNYLQYNKLLKLSDPDFNQNGWLIEYSNRTPRFNFTPPPPSPPPLHRTYRIYP